MSQVSVGDAPRLAAVCAGSGAPAPSDLGLVAGIGLPFSGPAPPSRSSQSAAGGRGSPSPTCGSLLVQGQAGGCSGPISLKDSCSLCHFTDANTEAEGASGVCPPRGRFPASSRA